MSFIHQSNGRTLCIAHVCIADITWLKVVVLVLVPLFRGEACFLFVCLFVCLFVLF